MAKSAVKEANGIVAKKQEASKYRFFKKLIFVMLICIKIFSRVRVNFFHSFAFVSLSSAERKVKITTKNKSLNHFLNLQNFKPFDEHKNMFIISLKKPMLSSKTANIL